MEKAVQERSESDRPANNQGLSFLGLGKCDSTPGHFEIAYCANAKSASDTLVRRAKELAYTPLTRRA